MKKILSASLLFALLASTTGTVISAEETAIPVDVDEAVYTQLLAQYGCDADGDGVVTEAEFRALKSFSVDLAEVAALDWLPQMDSLQSLHLKGGTFTDLSIIAQCPSLKTLILNAVPTEDISFIKDMELEYAYLTEMDWITNQQKTDVLRFYDVHINRGFSAVGGALPMGLFEYEEMEFTIEDTNIAYFDGQTENPSHTTASAIYGKAGSSTPFTISIAGEVIYTGTITVDFTDVKAIPYRIDPPETAVYESAFYSSGKIVVTDGDLCTMENGKLIVQETNVKAFDNALVYNAENQYESCDLVLFEDGTVKVNGVPLETELRFAQIGRGCCITENGELYSLRNTADGYVLDFVYAGFGEFIENSRMYFLSDSGEVVLKELLYLDDGAISYQAFETGITGIISNHNDYFVDTDNILWEVDRTVGGSPNMVKKAEDVVYVGYRDYNGSVYGCVHITSDGTAYSAGTTRQVTLTDRTDMSEHYLDAGNFNVDNSFAGGSQFPRPQNYHIDLNNALFMEWNGKQATASKVTEYIGCTGTADDLYVYFVGKDGSVWSYSFKNDTHEMLEPETASAETLQGDVNADGAVDTADIILLTDYVLAKTDGYAGDADVNSDGIINAFDLAVLKNICGKSQ